MNTQIVVTTDDEIQMRDGTILRGDLYLPHLQERCPVIVMRSVFRKNTLSARFGVFDPLYFARHGFAVYIQDVRGIGSSEGSFYRFIADRDDAYDTIENLAARRWCNGKVGAFGNYYAGFLTYQAAAARPPHLKAICPFNTHVSLNRNNDAKGVTLFYAHIGWCLAREISRVFAGHYSDEIREKYLDELIYDLKHYQEMVDKYPGDELPMRQLVDIFPIIKDYFDIALPKYDDLQAIQTEGRLLDLSMIKVPVLMASGVNESSRNSMIEHCDWLRRNGSGEARNSEVVIGNWNDDNPMASPESALYIPEMYFSIRDEILKWFEHWLKGTPYTGGHAYRIYDTGIGKFVSMDEWRANAASNRILYMKFTGNRAGRLTEYVVNTSDEGYATYTYDPHHPGRCYGYGQDCTAAEQEEDILTFTGDVLDQDLLVAGTPKIVLYVSTDCTDTDFITYLEDCDESGKCTLISDGIVRGRYRNSLAPEHMKPGEHYRFEIKVGEVLHTFRKGHRIRVQVRSADYPKFERNHNTGNRPERDHEFKIARNSVYCNVKEPSAVILPCE